MDEMEVKLSKDMQEAAESLGSNLAQSEPLVHYRQAVQALDSDPQSGELLQRLAAGVQYSPGSPGKFT